MVGGGPAHIPEGGGQRNQPTPESAHINPHQSDQKSDQRIEPTVGRQGDAGTGDASSRLLNISRVGDNSAVRTQFELHGSTHQLANEQVLINGKAHTVHTFQVGKDVANFVVNNETGKYQQLVRDAKGNFLLKDSARDQGRTVEVRTIKGEPLPTSTRIAGSERGPRITPPSEVKVVNPGIPAPEARTPVIRPDGRVPGVGEGRPDGRVPGVGEGRPDGRIPATGEGRGHLGDPASRNIRAEAIRTTPPGTVGGEIGRPEIGARPDKITTGIPPGAGIERTPGVEIGRRGEITPGKDLTGTPREITGRPVVDRGIDRATEIARYNAENNREIAANISRLQQIATSDQFRRVPGTDLQAGAINRVPGTVQDFRIPQENIVKMHGSDRVIGDLTGARIDPNRLDQNRFLLNNPELRLNLAQIMQDRLSGKFIDPLMAEKLAGLKPNQLTNLKDILTNQDTGKFIAGMQSLDNNSRIALKDLISLNTIRSNQEGLNLDQRSFSLRLLEFTRKQEFGFEKIPSLDQSKAMLAEMSRAWKLEQQNPLKDGRVTGSNEMIGRSLTERTGGQEKNDGLIFNTKMIDSGALQNLLTQMQNRDNQITTNKVLDAKQENITKAENTTTLNTKQETASINSTDKSLAAQQEIIRQNKVDQTELGKREQSQKQESQKPVDRAENTIAANILNPGARNPADSRSDYSNTYTEDTARKQKAELDQRLKDEEEKRKEKEEKDRELKEKKELENAKAQAEMALLLARKLKEQQEKDLKQKEKSQDQDKKDPKLKSRIRYRVREGDTLSNIAHRFLQDANLAAAIFHINKAVVPLRTHNNKRYADLRVNSLIWIPGDEDLTQYKKDGTAKNYVGIGFDGIKYQSAEEELNEKFGKNWTVPDEKAFKAERRAKVEEMLGPISQEKKEEKERIKYQVRLGDGLKSIALKHPIMQDVELWRLLALINDLSTETDERGTPFATLKRGMSIFLPTPQDISSYKQGTFLNNQEEPDSKEEEEEEEEAVAEVELEPFDLTEITIENNTEETQASLKPQEIVVADYNSLFNNDTKARRILILSSNARLTTQGIASQLGNGYQASLECFRNGIWETITSYHLDSETCIHTTFDGTYRRERPLNLPLTAVFELAFNDLSRNWQKHLALLD